MLDVENYINQKHNFSLSDVKVASLVDGNSELSFESLGISLNDLLNGKEAAPKEKEKNSFSEFNFNSPSETDEKNAESKV